MPRLTKITIYPIKSLDGVDVDQVAILASGALANDREFALVDQQGQVVNGKRTAKIQRVRSQFNLRDRTVSLNDPDTFNTGTFHLDHERGAISTWFSQFFGFPVQLVHNPQTGFPDDTIASGPTIISTATLTEVTAWFPNLSLTEVRARFRSNLELESVPPFWEDQLYAADPHSTIPFWLGEVQFEGVNPCQRCIVPTRHPITGDPLTNFQKIFVEHRKRSLPDWVASSRFNHYYRLAVNTRIPTSEAGKYLTVNASYAQSL